MLTEVCDSARREIHRSIKIYNVNFHLLCKNGLYNRGYLHHALVFDSAVFYSLSIVLKKCIQNTRFPWWLRW